jgi:dipeptidyl aminopeptidase/acylaminoacyl peptidase
MNRLILTFSAFLITASIFADTLTISRWLVAPGPSVSFPAFSETKNIKGDPFTGKELFSFQPVEISNHYPQPGSIFPGSPDASKKWIIAETDGSGFIRLENPGNNDGSSTYLSAYLTTGRWMKAELKIESRQMFEIHLNGKLLESKTSIETIERQPGKITREVVLPAGKHLIVIRTFQKSNQDVPWQLSGKIGLPSYAVLSDIKTELHPRQGKNINHLLDGVKTGVGHLSPDGKLYAIQFSRTLPPSDQSENWIEIKRVSDGKLIHSFRHASIQAFSWAPSGNILSYRTNRDGKSTLWIYDLDKGKYFPLLENIDNFWSYAWSPDASFIIYSLQEKADEDKGGARRLLGMQDRLPGYRTRNFLYRADINTLHRERLTHGFLSTFLHDIAPDSKTILFSQSRPDYLERPYSKQDIFLMDLQSGEVDTILKDLRWSVSGQFSPDGKQLLFTGGPSAFGTPGENIPEGRIANNYDRQAYIYDIGSRSVDPFTREFDPSVSQSFWNRADNNIYLVTGHEDYVQLFRYNIKSRRFTRIETGEDVLNWIRFANDRPVALISGSGMSTPPSVSFIDLKSGKYHELENPDKNNFRNVEFGQNIEWDFRNSEGIRIPGRVYLPPGFDESKKYPLIVYYYGGTTPVSRSFGGRYPFNMYAANGYVVYVLQPSGAIGFGQEFSSMHVNNWGITVADEIIQGTREFLAGHPFIDPERVGCMGASYGGFMTMLLQTRTDIFAAAISHAGISSISSYWGEGYWGYGYSAEASAESFPWNNRALYVDQSPLFHADRINTPLLLLHGTSDTNVPPGESIQLYVALKLLGKPVELVEIEDEDHHIITYNKRIAWSNTKLAWFDKWLKNQPEWWEYLFPEKNL